MMIYLIKSIACLLILLLVHRMLLQREAMHRFNRFFLLFSVVVSFFIPLYTIEVPEEIVAAPLEVISEPVYFEASNPDFNQEQVFAPIPESQLNWEYLLLGLYGLISLIFFYRFIKNIKILFNKIQRNIKINYRGQTLVLLKEDSLPFSFLKYIFVAESDLENGKFTDAVFAHECTHIQERHSWDNLFIEALLVPLWFHPGLHWAKQVIKLNHEFIADEVALRSTPLEKYESQLLAMMLSEQKYGLVSSLNFSLTKKRFDMMTRKTKPTNKWLKLAFLIPVLGAVIYLFSEKVDGKSVDLTEKADLSLPNDDSSTNTDVYTIVYGRQLTRSTTGQFQRASSPIGQLVNSSSAYDDYKNLTDEYLVELEGGVHFIQKSESEQESLLAMFTNLSGYYFKLSDSEKRQAGKPKHPFAPYLRIESNGKMAYKMPEDLTESERKQLSTALPQAKESKELANYNRELNTYELNRNKGQHYIGKTPVAQKLVMDYYDETQRTYALLPLDEKRLTKVPTHPFAPYVRIENGLNSYFKLAKDLTEEERKNMAC